MAARRRWSRADSPVGPIPQLIPPITWDDEAPSAALPAIPALGEHNQAIRAEFAD